MPEPAVPSALHEYIAVVRRRRAPILIVLLVVCAGTMALTMAQAPTYEATASVLLQPYLSESLGDSAPVADLSQDQSEVEVMRSRSVADLAADQLGHVPTVAMDTIPDTRVVEVTASSSDPATAAADATGYARAYVESRRQGILDELDKVSAILQERLAQVEAELVVAEQPLRDLQARVATTGDAFQRVALEGELAQLDTQLSADLFTRRARRTALQQRVDQLGLTSQLTITGGAKLISAALEPSSPVEPQPVRNAALGLVAGLVLGLGLAFLLDQLDDRVHGRDEIETATGGLAIVGLIPYSKRWRRVASPAELQDNPALAEAFRALRTSIHFAALDAPMRSIQVTSASAADGKTTTVAGLAITLAQAGKRVVVVDGDLRRPRLHELFDIDPAVGLTNALADEATIGEVLHRIDDSPGLALMPCGSEAPNPSELLALERFRALIITLQGDFDFVVVDTPPVLPVADARIVAGAVDATLLVVAAERSKVKDVQLATDLLRQVDAPVVGVVLSQVPVRRHVGYGYGYGGYGGYAAKSAKSRKSAESAESAESGKHADMAHRSRAASATSGSVGEAGDVARAGGARTADAGAARERGRRAR
jgi:capsular exopolysaccharide synthesis family protein